MPEDVSHFAEPDQVQDLGVEFPEALALCVSVQHDELLFTVGVRMNVVDGEDAAVGGRLGLSRGGRFRQRARQLPSELDDGVAAELVDAAVDGHLLEHLDLRRLRPEGQREAKELQLRP